VVLSVDTILSREGVTISDVACRHTQGRGDDEHYVGRHMIVFVRRGCFVRSSEGDRALLDSSVAYCVNPGDEQRYDHPHPGGDDCTSLTVSEPLLGELVRTDDRLPRGTLRTSSRADLEHRLLLAAVRRGDDEHEALERALLLLRVMLRGESGGPRATTPAAARAHCALADTAREALSADPDCSLSELAQMLAVSPWHLSRVFSACTGQTLARHRLRARTRRALERLAGGEQDLARLAAEVGFADQSHLCRVIRRETGTTPRALRRALAPQSERRTE
jgi:AraC-like DNA-binding protein